MESAAFNKKHLSLDNFFKMSFNTWKPQHALSIFIVVLVNNSYFCATVDFYVALVSKHSVASPSLFLCW